MNVGYTSLMATFFRMLFVCFYCALSAQGERDVYITGVPDYNWYYGCFGTGSGNLMGYWDRNGFPDIYTGPVNGGLAPLNTSGANEQIYTLWASRAGYGGRASNNWGHVDDYYAAYMSINNPYRLAGRQPHTNDCIGDFMGLSHYNWTNLNGECNGNINAFAFNYFDTSGVRRQNFAAPTPDIQSGLRAYLQYCGYDADIISQVADVYPKTPAGRGFNFFDFMQCIDAGFPVLLQLQINSYARGDGTNPDFHAILGYGYQDYGGSAKDIYVHNSWAQGEKIYSWNNFPAVGGLGFYLRGVYILMPKPEITSVSGEPGNLTVEWQGASSVLSDEWNGGFETTHWYVVENGSLTNPSQFSAVSPATTARSLVLTNPVVDFETLRVRNLTRVRFQDDALGTAVLGQITNKYGPTNFLFDLDLEQVRSVVSPSNGHWNLRGLEYTVNATNYDLRGNFITNLEILTRTASRGGMRAGTHVDLRGNPTNGIDFASQVSALTNAGATVQY